MKPFTDTLNAMRFGTLTDDLTDIEAETGVTAINGYRID